jgi:hypothetical protein
VLQEAERGVRFDRIAILLRSPQQYLGLLEHACTRGGVPVYFDRGTRRPDPAGRAFLALLACASEGLSAKRFAEYLSLAQVPAADEAMTDAPFTPSGDKRCIPADDDTEPRDRAPEPEIRRPRIDAPVPKRAARAVEGGI